MAAMTTAIPPRVVIMATGAEGGAYNEFGKQYREILVVGHNRVFQKLV